MKKLILMCLLPVSFSVMAMDTLDLNEFNIDDMSSDIEKLKRVLNGLSDSLFVRAHIDVTDYHCRPPKQKDLASLSSLYHKFRKYGSSEVCIIRQLQKARNANNPDTLKDVELEDPEQVLKLYRENFEAITEILRVLGTCFRTKTFRKTWEDLVEWSNIPKKHLEEKSTK